MKKIIKVATALFLTSLLIGCTFSKKEYKSYEEYPVYEGNDMELTYSSEKSSFRVWSPNADSVVLSLYEDGIKGKAYRSLSMKRSKKGTWKATVKGDLKGKFYTFRVKIGDKWLNHTPGIWAKAVGINGQRGAIVDMNETNPQGWENDQHQFPNNPTDAIIYEVHMRDFSVSPNSGMNNKGKFLAFTEKGTKNSFGQATGIDHLKELGITHIHLLPSFDYASIDESRLEEKKYNWGYDPQNYNVPEGSYSTNPANPTQRIKELKQLIQSVHKEGIGVIMDVVYNHTYVGGESHINQLVPGYFYRFNQDSTWSNASGCGNEIASERPMVRKFMVESLVYWAKEYHIDGFRFDLMGIHDIETMNAIRQELNTINPKILLYGEGWTAAGSPLAEEKRALKKNVKKLDGIAVFSDDIRDALKGNWTDKLPGFVAGRENIEDAVKFGIVGGIDFEGIDSTRLMHSSAPYTENPTQIVNYASCHDDMCLVDKLKSRRPKGATDKEIQKFHQLAQTIVLTSQGIPFIYAGEEIYRDKKGVNNTYKSPDDINQINWDNKKTYNHIFTYYKDLIALRKSHPAFRMTTGETVRKYLHFIDTKVPNVIAYQLLDNANGDEWSNIMVIFNGNRKDVKIALPKGTWNVAVENGGVGLETPLRTVSSEKITVKASSATILYQK